MEEEEKEIKEVKENKNEKSNNLMLPVVGIIVVLVLIVMGYMLANFKKQTSQQDATSASPGVDVVNANVKTITVEGGSYYFKPSEITVKKGDQVKIIFTSNGGMHDFVVDELNIKTPITGDGKTADATFTATKSGTFEFYCSVANHRQMGMVGKLVVTD